MQLERIAQRARERKLALGLYRDLALGADRAGAESWAQQAAFALDASTGAPPDDYNVNGQDWGLPPFHPQHLGELAYAPYVAMLRANMRHAGVLRLDHVMGLQRLFWVPPGRKATEGAYVDYPFRALLSVLALESERSRCLVVGEDLGTVSPALRKALREALVLSYRPFYFEKEADGSYRAPRDYPAQALASLGTHDWPTLRGFLAGQDLHWRERLGLYPSEAARTAQLALRKQERSNLLAALQREGFTIAAGSESLSWSPALAVALYEYVARSPARLLLVQPEDVFGDAEQANLPGTVDQHPNWRRKLALELEQWVGHSAMIELAQALNRSRGGPGGVRP